MSVQPTITAASQSFRIQCEGALERIEETTSAFQRATAAIESGAAFQLDLQQLDAVTRVAIDRLVQKLELGEVTEGRATLQALSHARERLRLAATGWARAQRMLEETDDLAALVEKAQAHLPITWDTTGGIPRAPDDGRLVTVLALTALVCTLLACADAIWTTIVEWPLRGGVWVLMLWGLLAAARRRPFERLTRPAFDRDHVWLSIYPFQRERLALTRSALLVGGRALLFSDIERVSLHESNRLEVEVVLRTGGRVKIQPDDPDEFAAAATALHVPIEVTPATLARRRLREASRGRKK